MRTREEVQVSSEMDKLCDEIGDLDLGEAPRLVEQK
jgi:hypothetical protein